MYIKKIVDRNLGPIKDIGLECSFHDNGNPKPIVIVGENGSGKSVLLSNIVDALYEMAGKAYNNALQDAGINEGYQYYKTISHTQIRVREEYMYSHIIFEDDIHYIFKSGDLKLDDFKKLREPEADMLSEWDDGNYKNITINKDKVKKIFEKDVICFFGPDRYEKPNWMGNKYYSLADYEHPSANSRWAGKLKNPILVKDVTTSNLQWLMDVIVDSRGDIQVGANGSLEMKHNFIPDLQLLGTARKNLEKIMGEILGEEVYFGLNYRNYNNSRFNINSKSTGEILIPTLDSLSTGQSAIFNMFSTIVRYADNNNIIMSIHLNDITGIVVIDEIDLHLHTTLQREVLPHLIKLFPKVQFIITTHSPLFVLGMDEVFGSENYDIFQMPTATKINAECFSEFQNAYNYFAKTIRYQSEIESAINSNNDKALIITEGATDWKHMLAAYQALSQKEDFKESMQNIEFDFLKYEPKVSKEQDVQQLEMGDSQLCTMCENFANLPQKRKLIFIADRDVEKTNKILGENGKLYKSWGNNVFSMLLPLPEHRQNTPEICIEHYYTDEEIKTPVVIDGIERRLYMGNEFNSKGINVEQDIFCEKRNICGENKITIIEGSEKEKVTKLSDSEGANLALSKMNFANKILNKEYPFCDMGFDAFRELFKIIKMILDRPNE